MPRTFHDAAFQAVVDTLMADPDLRDLVKTWRRWSNDPKDDGRSDDVTSGLCPLVWLTPTLAGPASRLATDSLVHLVEVRMAVEIEVWVGARPRRGLHRSDALDLSALIWGALWPGDREERARVDDRFRAVGVVDVVPRNPILPGIFNTHLMGCFGSVELVQHINL